MYLKSLAIPAAALIAVSASAQTVASDPATRIRDYLEQCRAAQVCNGAYIVARDGKQLYRGAVGDAGDTARTPLTADYAFDIGSISKQFTAMAVLKLAASGKLALTDPVVKYLPDFPYSEVTIEQLLNHTSGIPDMLPYYGAILRAGTPRAPIIGSELVALLNDKKLPLTFPAGSKFAYNNTAYMVAALVIDKVAGEPLDSYLDRSFFKPLGMKNTRVRMPANEVSIAPRAMGFRPSPDGTRRPNEQLPGFYVRGAGGIYSTVSDLLRWENALTSGRVVPLAYWKRALTPVKLTDGKTYPYGYGLKLKPTAGGVRRYNHDGDWRGFKANMAYYPDARITIIQLTNNSEDDSADVNEEALATLAGGGTVEAVLPAIGRDLYARLGDPATAQAWFAGERAAQPPRYVVREDELNAMGYRLLDQKQVAKALLVFKLNAAAFPQSANALDSLAEGQEAAGDLTAARDTMRAAMALNPKSKAIREHAVRLGAADGTLGTDKAPK